MEYHDLVLINRVELNIEGFSCIELSGSIESRQALEIFGYPSQKKIYRMVRTINSCSVRIQDVCNTNNICGYDVPTLNGKTVLQKPEHVQTEYIEIPDSLRERTGKLMVSDDVMFVTNIPFVVSFSSGVNFKMVEYVSQRLKTALANYIVKIFQFYKNNGYTIKDVHDG